MSRVEHLAEGVVLHLGDCRDILPTLGKADAVVTDPPYGIGFAAQPTTGQRAAGMKPENWDDIGIDNLDAVCAMAPTQIIWGGNYYNLPPTRAWKTEVAS